jgi:hypothetical protein
MILVLVAPFFEAANAEAHRKIPASAGTNRQETKNEI